MALIKCSNCGKDYSNLLSVCKYCNNRKELKWKEELIEDVPQSKSKFQKPATIQLKDKRNAALILIIFLGVCYYFSRPTPPCECVDAYENMVLSSSADRIWNSCNRQWRKEAE